MTDGSEDTVVLGSPMPSTMTFHIWDDFERALPGKVSFFPVDDAVDVMNEDLGDARTSQEIQSWFYLLHMVVAR